MTLEQLVDHVLSIYGKCNEVNMPNFWQRLALLNAGVRYIRRAIKKGRTEEYPILLASLFARWVAAITVLCPHDVATRVAEKFGEGCAYCGEIPCGQECKEKSRPDPHYLTPTEEQINRSLHSWQHHFGSIFGDKNRANGIGELLLHLYDESGESLEEWLMLSMGGNLRNPQIANRQKLVRELVDTFAFIVGLANMLEIDLEQAVLDYYKDGCPVCHQRSCIEYGDAFGTLSGKARTVFAT